MVRCVFAVLTLSACNMSTDGETAGGETTTETGQAWTSIDTSELDATASSDGTDIADAASSRGGDESATSVGEEEPGFASVFAVFETGCGCHAVPNHPSGLASFGSQDTAYGSLVDAPSLQGDFWLAMPGSPDDSYLWIKIIGTQHDFGGSGERMPPGEGAELTDEDTDLVRRWIEAGCRP